MSETNGLRIPSLYALVFLLILSAPASAIVMAPAIKYIDYEPGFNASYTFSVMGASPGTYIRIHKTGELKEYFKTSITELPPGAGKTYFTVDVELPEEEGILPPGTHYVAIIAGEYPVTEREGTLAAYAAVEGKIFIRVPYPHKFLKVSINTPNVNIGEPVDFYLFFENLGLEDLVATGVVRVYDDSGKLLATLYTNEIFVGSGNNTNMEVTWDAGEALPGRYYATFEAEYGGAQTATSRKDFKVGDILLRIINVTQPESIEPGDIAKFEVHIDSFWNQKISNAFVSLEALLDGAVMGGSKSESFDIDAWEDVHVQVFWDTDGLEDGTYDLNFTAYYEGRSTEKIIEAEIKTPLDFSLLIIAAALVIIIAIVAIVFLLKRRKRDREA
jgi:hypothetical protein